MWLFLNIKLELTRQARWHVDLGVEPLVGQQLWHSIQCLYSECVVGVGEKIDHSHRSLRQAHLLGDKADARPARLALPPDAPPARHAVGQICPASCVRWCGPFQDQCGLLQGVDQVSRRGGGPWRDKSLKKFLLGFLLQLQRIDYSSRNREGTRQYAFSRHQHLIKHVLISAIVMQRILHFV